MGLFDFLKRSGSSSNASNAAAEAAKAAEARATKIDNLKGILSSTGIPIENLDVDLDGNNVVVYGQAQSAADKDKLVMVLGNMNGVNAVDDRISVVAPVVETQTYEVQPGDSLSKIAKKFYGDPMKYKDIFEANQPLLKDPNMIHPGQVLNIPK